MPLHIIRQDITKIRCDAVVNPTNPELIPGGSTDEANHTAAGPKLAETCAKLPGCELRQAVISPAFDLPCKYVIHTVGPVWKDAHTVRKHCWNPVIQNPCSLRRSTSANPLHFR